MLILTRRLNERILIGKDGEISIAVLKIDGGQVRIGIDAPKDIPVHREEIYHKILDEKEEENYTKELINNERNYND